MTQVCERHQPAPAQSPQSTTHALPLLALGATLILWASAFVVIGHVGQEFSPGSLALGRTLVASAMLGIILVVRRRSWRRLARGDLVRIAVIGALWFAGYSITLNAGQQRVDAGTAAMLVQVSPLLVAVMATSILGEHSSIRTWAGLLVAFAGVSLIGLARPGDERDVVSIALCLLAAAASAVGVILHQPLLSRLSGLQVTWLACTAGTIVCLPYGGALTHDLASAPGRDTALVIFLGVFPTAIAFTLYAYAMSHMSVSSFAASTYLVPPLTIAMAWFVLDESPAPMALLGGALCLAGVVLARRPAAPTPAPQRARAVRGTR